MVMITNSYDTLEQKQTEEDAKLKVVDRVYHEIKKYKNKLADCVNREIVQQVMLAEAEASGLQIDPEMQMSDQQIMLMVAEASMILEELEEQERQIVSLKVSNKTRKIKCQYCEHKGSSMMEESVHAVGWVICLFLLICFGLYSLIITPFILGIFV